MQKKSVDYQRNMFKEHVKYVLHLQVFKPLKAIHEEHVKLDI